MAEITKIRAYSPHKNKENSPPPAPPTGGEKRGGGEREMVKNYQKLKKIIISPKCPKTVQKISKKNYFLNFCKR